MLQTTAVAVLLAVCGQAAAQTCQPQWSTDFVVMGMDPAPQDLIVFDEDGPGPIPPAFYATAGGGVHRWNGSAWSVVGAGISGAWRLVAFDDDGAGPAHASLFVSGLHEASGSHVAKWDGAGWVGLAGGPPPLVEPSQCSSEWVSALDAFDPDGPGPEPAYLYASMGGSSVCGGASTWGKLWRWNGSAWQASPNAQMSIQPIALAMSDGGGTGLRLYAAGNGNSGMLSGFTSYAGVWSASPSGWESIGFGTWNTYSALASFDPDGSGPALSRLVLGGLFPDVNGVAAANIASWNGAWWSPLGTGTSGSGVEGGRVNALVSFRSPGAVADALYAAGEFSSAGGLAAARIARWDGLTWSAVGAGVGAPRIQRLRVLDEDADGPTPAALYALGPITLASGQPAQGIARWHGTNWSPAGHGLNNEVHALALVGSGQNRRLIAGGLFVTASGHPSIGIASWDGASWSPLGAGANHHVDALAELDDGSGPALYAGGKFTLMGGDPASRIARWNGAAWSPLGTGLNGPVNAIAVYDDGSGPALYAGGAFTSAGGLPASNIAVWRSGQWAALGAGVSGPVHALAAFQGALYVGGEFGIAGGSPSANLASWSASGWTAFGANLLNDAVLALAVFNDGSGESLFVGGRFIAAGSYPLANHLAKLNGNGFGMVGSGLDGEVRALTVFDRDGSGPAAPALYVGGSFTTAGATPAANLASWSNQGWTPVAGGTSGPVLALAGGEFQGRPTLFPGGQFTQAGGVSSPRIAALVGCEGCYANCDSSWTAPVLNVADFTCFLNAFASGDPYANCDASTIAPTLNVADFTCFLNRFAAGCH